MVTMKSVLPSEKNDPGAAAAGPAVGVVAAWAFAGATALELTGAGR